MSKKRFSGANFFNALTLHRERAALLLSAARQFAGLKSAAMAWLLISAFSMLHWLEPLDLSFFDTFSHFQLRSKASPDVLLVEIPYAQQGISANNWPEIAGKLLAAGAGKVVFTLPLSVPELEALSKHPGRNKLVFGIPRGAENTDEKDLLSQITTIERLGLRAAVFGQHGHQNIVRSIDLDYRIGEKKLRSIKAEASEWLGSSPVYLPMQFSPTTLPVISLSRLKEEGPMPELVRQRVVLIGLEHHPLLQSVNIPGHHEEISLLRYHGMAINALLKNATVKPLGLLTSNLLTGLFALLFLAALQPLPLRSANLFLLVTVTIEIAATWLIFNFAATWLPLLEIILCEIAVFLCVYRAKAVREWSDLQQMVSNTAAELQRRTQPEGFMQSETYWDFVVRLVDQTLHLHRTIFLERVDNDHRLREIQSLRCDIADIHEMRRDYERTPYTTAIAARHAIEVNGFLKPINIVEHQFLAPLLFGGEVMGFWAFSVTENEYTHINQQKTAINAIADQVSVLLFQRKMQNKNDSARHNPLERLFADSNLATLRKLNQSTRILEQRMQNLEHIFNHISSAAILYDLFGRVMQINPRMNALLKGQEIAPFSMTAVDLIGKLCNIPIEDVRGLMRELVLEREPFSLSTHLSRDETSHYTLLAAPLVLDEQVVKIQGAPFQINGILIELLDTSAARHSFDLSADTFFHISLIITDKLQTIATAAHLLAPPDTPEEMRQQAAEILQASLYEATEWLHRARRLLIPDAALPDLLVEPCRQLRRALALVDDQIKKRQLSPEISMPNFSRLVHASPEDLKDVFCAILIFLIEDSAPDSRLMISVTTKPQAIVIIITNEGYGLPQERLQDYLEKRPIETLNNAFRDLRHALHLVEQWEGQMSATSEIGKGSCVTLTLRVYE